MNALNRPGEGTVDLTVFPPTPVASSAGRLGAGRDRDVDLVVARLTDTEGSGCETGRERLRRTTGGWRESTSGGGCRGRGALWRYSGINRGRGPRTAPPAAQTAPTVAGQPYVGSFLTASAGSWSGTPASYKYKWFANGDALSGERKSSLIVHPEDQGANITVEVTATNSDGSSTAASKPTPVIEPSPWSRVPGWRRQYAMIQGFACASASACFAFVTDSNQTRGFLVTFHGKSWSSPRALAHATSGGLACAADGFCLLITGVDSDGESGFWRYSTYRHGSWSKPRSMPKLATQRDGTRWYGGYFEPSCTSNDLCTAVMGGNYHFYGAGGSGGWLVTYRSLRHAVRPPAQSWMPRNKGKSHWTAPVQATSGGHLYSAVCTSPTHCLVGDDQHNTAGLFNGKHWSHEVKMDSIAHGTPLISCVDGEQCFAEDLWYDGRREWNGRTWLHVGHGPQMYCDHSVGCDGFTSLDRRTAGGTYEYPTLERLDGAKAVPVSVAFDADQSRLSDATPAVDCASKKFCILVAGRGQGNLSDMYRLPEPGKQQFRPRPP
jgi:hypothetical protein